MTVEVVFQEIGTVLIVKLWKTATTKNMGYVGTYIRIM